jgi:hypothetical protein
LAGPNFEIGLVSDPLIAPAGTARIVLALASCSATTIQLTSNDTNVSVPTSVTIPPGSVTVDVPFRIASTFDTSRVFAIQAQVGSESHTAYGTKPSSNQRLGFSGFFVNGNNYTVLPSQTTPDYGPWILSTGGYATELSLSCTGLPAGTNCQFGTNPIELAPGAVFVSTLTVATSASVPPGVYHFNYVLSDGTLTLQIPATLTVVTAQLPQISGSVTPSSATITVGAKANFTLSLQGQNGASGPFTFSCVPSNPNVTCSFNPSPLNLPTNGSASGTLTVAVSGHLTSTLPLSHHFPQAFGITSLLFTGLSLLCFFVSLWCLFRLRLSAPVHSPRFAAAALTISGVVLLALILQSCAGGGAASSTPASNSPPPLPPQSLTMSIETGGPGVTGVLGTVTVQIPQ